MVYKDLSEKEKQTEMLNLLKGIKKNTAGGGGGGGAIKKLTADDYDYPENNPTMIAGWLLEPDYYQVEGENVTIARTPTENHHLAFDTGDMFVKVTEAAEVTQLTPPNYVYTQHKNDFFGFSKGTAASDGKDMVLTMDDVVDSLTSTSASAPLAAAQGKALSDRTGALSDLTTTDKTSIVAAINELVTATSGVETTLNTLNSGNGASE